MLRPSAMDTCLHMLIRHMLTGAINRCRFRGMCDQDALILQRAVDKAGSVAALARCIGAKTGTVFMWRYRKSLPDGWRAYLAEKVDDPNWPHPDGRPCIDVAAKEAA